MESIPNNMANEEKQYLTKERHAELTEELNRLKNTEREKVARQLESAKEFGDLSENAEYHEARDMQAQLEARIREIENLLKYAEIIEHKKSSEVEVGSTVVVRKSRAKDEQTFHIVGSEEADAEEGKISNTSPLGRALLGKKEGQKARFETPSGKKTFYEILKIE